VHRTNLYAWARGTEIPADIGRVRGLARVLRLEEGAETELVNRWESSRTAKKAAAVVGQFSDLATHHPEALTYDPDLESADIQALMEKADSRDRETLLRMARAFLTEQRRRH
jgi:hypothetical protein